MSTGNLGLETIEASDYISPDPINRNMTKIDALGVDYVVSQGTSGQWWYRKWNSGRAECGIDNKSFGNQSMSLMQNASNLYKTPSLNFGAYPFNFVSRPYVSITFHGDSAQSGRGSFIVQQHSTSTSTTPTFFIVDWSRNTMNPYCGIYVCGRWK